MQEEQQINISEQANEEPEKPKNFFDFKNMRWYEWLAALPAIFLLVAGGAVGAVFGLIGWGITLKVIRNKGYSTGVKLLIIVGITILYYVLFFVLAAVIAGFIYGI